ncbi:PLP-dependent aminotransferase family protein [Undibacterium cyanobacteriorum]|uniref:PLP-dependent aminotransferase family protein n=1 Tax=Undibacterium cyanobacteriorum TaxID=3073561 RepID=A0ABY9RFR5_9BURK|nr:PLP-dependent aminotransferase family protein [Undibacterium sp. 20NA77.5]WMW79693.1 PLP-dependent aminotransferase family protein [Undibacterium sp. 20NA77.5]
MDFQVAWHRYLQEGKRRKGEGEKWSTQRQLHAFLRQSIQTGLLPAGSKLASSRNLALELGIARNTVVYAYEQLLSEGFVNANRQGSVVNDIGVMLDKNLVSHDPDKAVGSLSKRAESLIDLPVPAELSGAFAPGIPAVDTFSTLRWRRLLEQEWRRCTPRDLAYGEACGETTLRIAIADYLRASRGVICDAEQVFITDGTQSSLDLCARVFADAGDKVWIENPGYVGAQLALKAAQLKMIGIEVDDEGMAPRAQDWSQHQPKLIYVTPSHQYPTGKVMSVARRLDLLRQAKQHQSLIIEDDYDSEFRHEGPPLPAMQGLISDAPVLYLGTFSKTLFPAIRVAYMIVPQNLTSALRLHFQRAFLRGRAIEQKALARFVSEGHFAQHVRRMRRLYRERRDALVQALEDYLPEDIEVHGDTAGMHLALRFVEGQHGMRSDLDISERALRAGLVVPALSKLAVGRRHSAWRGLMLGYAQIPADQMRAKVRALVDLF